MEARKGAFALPFLGTIPSSRGVSHPLHPRPTVRRLDTVGASALNPITGHGRLELRPQLSPSGEPFALATTLGRVDFMGIMSCHI